MIKAYNLLLLATLTLYSCQSKQKKHLTYSVIKKSRAYYKDSIGKGNERYLYLTDEDNGVIEVISFFESGEMKAYKHFPLRDSVEGLVLEFSKDGEIIFKNGNLAYTMPAPCFSVKDSLLYYYFPAVPPFMNSSFELFEYSGSEDKYNKVMSRNNEHNTPRFCRLKEFSSGSYVLVTKLVAYDKLITDTIGINVKQCSLEQERIIKSPINDR